MRFDTCYHGHYYEIFYVFLDLKDPSNPQIVAHTLPNCMPLRMWVEKYLRLDVQSFTQCVSLHLNSYIARREQIREAETEFASQVEIVASDSFQDVDVDFQEYRIKLHYALDQRLPSEVERVVNATLPATPRVVATRPNLSKQSLSLFKEKPLDAALRSFLSHFLVCNKHANPLPRPPPSPSRCPCSSQIGRAHV